MHSEWVHFFNQIIYSPGWEKSHFRPQYWIKCSCGYIFKYIYFFNDNTSLRRYSLTHLQAHKHTHTHTHANARTKKTQLSSRVDPPFYLFNLFISQCSSSVPPPFASPSSPSIPLCLAQWRGEDGGTEGGRSVCVCVCVCRGGAFENSSSIAVVLWWSREWYREIMKRRTKALSSRCDWYPPLLLPSSQPASLPLSALFPSPLHLSLSLSLSFPSFPPRSLTTFYPHSRSLSPSQPPFPPSPFLPFLSLSPPCPCSFTWHSCTERGGVFVNNKKVRFRAWYQVSPRAGCLCALDLTAAEMLHMHV